MTAQKTHKLLVIDDHPETLDIISRVLQQQGYVVVAATSGIDGLSLVDSETPDLILVDGMMPEMDGWEFCRRVRANADAANTPIIMFSAVNEAEQKLAGFEAGADDYLTKPTEPVELAERVKAMLEGIPARTDRSTEEMAKAGAVPVQTQLASPQQTMALADSNSLIATLGVRGGVGTTLLAINLAVCLAQQENDTVLVDLDMAQGHVGRYLQQRLSNGLNKLASLPEGMLKAEIGQHLISYQDNLQLLLAENNMLEKEITLSANQAMEIMEYLAQPERCVVVDCGRGVTAANRPVIEQADQLIVCLRPERVALGIAKEFIGELQDIIIPPTQVSAVMLDFSGQMNVPQQVIEGFIGHPLAAVIPVAPADLNRSVNKSLPLVTLHPEAKAAALINQLARQVIEV